MSEFQSLSDESRRRWDANAETWDTYMGDSDNNFHNQLIVPATLELLHPVAGQRIIEIACGHGNFARRLDGLGVSVTAFDFSAELIKRARRRSKGTSIDYKVIDATDAAALHSLAEAHYHAAVANMALMDIAALGPLIETLSRILLPGGRFVFSVMHPCFQPPGVIKAVEETETPDGILTNNSVRISRYISPESYEGFGLRHQPTPQLYFHRPLSVLLEEFFERGFTLDAIREPVFKGTASEKFEWENIPPVLVCRLRYGARAEGTARQKD